MLISKQKRSDLLYSSVIKLTTFKTFTLGLWLHVLSVIFSATHYQHGLRTHFINDRNATGNLSHLTAGSRHPLPLWIQASASECWTRPFRSQSKDALLLPHGDTASLHPFPVRPREYNVKHLASPLKRLSLHLHQVSELPRRILTCTPSWEPHVQQVPVYPSSP